MAPSRQASSGGCFIFVGVIALIVANIYVVKPAVKGLAFSHTACTVTSRTVGDDDPHPCDCGPYCDSTAPCIKVYVAISERSNASLLHYTISDLMQFPLCSVNNYNCDLLFAENVVSALTYLNENLQVNSSFGCYYDGSDVVLYREYSTRDVVFAILWPSLLILLGLCMCRTNDGRSFGLMLFLAPFMLLGLIFSFVLDKIVALRNYCRSRSSAPVVQRCTPINDDTPPSPPAPGRISFANIFRRRAAEQLPEYSSLRQAEEPPPSIDAPFVPLLPLAAEDDEGPPTYECTATRSQDV